MQILGVFNTIYGADAEMTMSRAFIISVIGFVIVFVILGILAVFVKLMGTGFDKVHAAKKAKLTVPADEAPTFSNKAALAAAGFPLPDNTSAGELKLTDVSEQDAAVIMALVSHNSGIPLNRLQFNSIKLMEDDNK